jgi:hypothetical protein
VGIIDLARALGKRGLSKEQVTHAIRNRVTIENKYPGDIPVFGPLGAVCAATYPDESLKGLLARDQAAAIGASVRMDGITPGEELSIFTKAYEVTFGVPAREARAATCTLSLECGDLNNRVVALNGCDQK